MLPFLSTLLLSQLFISLIRAGGYYTERLDLTPLDPPSLLASFQFWGNSSLKSYEQQHFRFIPRSLGQILQHSRTQELHLRFSSGRWDDEGWGAKPHEGRKEGGTGVEIWAWVKADSDAELISLSCNGRMSTEIEQVFRKMDDVEQCPFRPVLCFYEFH